MAPLPVRSWSTGRRGSDTKSEVAGSRACCRNRRLSTLPALKLSVAKPRSPALLDDMGLPAALRHYVDNFATLTGLQTTLTVRGENRRLPGNTETVFFRITQEALTNIARHAQASRAWIELRCNETEATIQIKDNGIGFDPSLASNESSRSGWGLMGIKERAKLAEGEVQIHTAPGQGTNLSITIPVNNHHHRTTNESDKITPG